MTNIAKRELWIDFSKGIGIILVVIGHAERGLFSAGFNENKYFAEVIDRLLYSFHMPLFFILSGLLIGKSSSSFSTIILRRFKAILIPYIIWSLIQGFIEIQASSFKNQVTSTESVLNFLWQPRAQFWFLYVLFFIILVYSAATKIGIKSTWLCLISLILALFSDFLDKVWVLNKIMYYLFFFSLGALIGMPSRSWFSSKVSLILCVIFGFSIVTFVAMLEPDYDNVFQKTTISILLALIGSFAVIALSQLLSKCLSNIVTNLLDYLGQKSMEIYLMHVIWLGFARLLWIHLIKSHDFIFALPFVVVFGVLGPLITASFFIRIHLQHILFGFR